MSFEIEVNAGSSVKLPTAGKYCDRDIVVTATDGDGGYDEGYADGVAKVEESNAAILTDCNAVLPSKGAETADTLEQVPQRIGEIESYADGYDVGLEDGKQSEYDRFWDAYQQNGNKTSYDQAFAYTHWTDGSFNPKYDIVCVGGVSARQTFNNGRMTSTKVPIRVKNTSLNNTFTGSTIKTIVLLELDGVTDMSTSFNSCSALENITISGVIACNVDIVYSPLLTNESVQSIIDHLADRTGTTALTLTFHADVGAKLTEEQKATITAKNWTLVY